MGLWTLIATLLWPSARPARGAAAGMEEFWKVGRITFEGNAAFGEGELRKWIRTQTPSFPWHPFRRSLYRRDFIRGDKEFLQAFYRRQGFLAAVVDDRSTFDPDRHQVDVAFVIAEGVRTFLDSVSYSGVTLFTDNDLRKDSYFKKGDPFNPFAVQTERDRVARMYADLGYYPSDSVRVDSTARGVVVQYLIREGRPVTVREVRLQTGLKNRPFVLYREMDTRPGKPLSQKSLEEDQARLYGTDLFQNIQLRPVRLPPPEDTLADISLDVVERKPRWLEGGVGYGTHDFLRLSNGIGTRSLAWTGRRLSAQTTLAFGIPGADSTGSLGLQEGRLDLSLSQPWFFGSRTQAELHVYDYLQKADELLPEYQRGIALTLTRSLTRITKARLGIAHEGLNPFGAPGFTSNLAQAGIDRDHRDNAFDPVYGSYQQANLMVAGGVLGGSTTFHREVLTLNLYRPVSVRHSVVAMRVSGGLAQPFTGGDTLQPVYRFTTGGANTVRGYKENEILGDSEVTDPNYPHRGSVGGQVMLMTNLELRFPISGLISGALFLDGGGVWHNAAEISLSCFSPYALHGPDSFRRYRYSVGGGIRFNTPVGPFRLDYGQQLNPPESARVVKPAHSSLHLSLGQAF